MGNAGVGPGHAQATPRPQAEQISGSVASSVSQGDGTSLLSDHRCGALMGTRTTKNKHREDIGFPGSAVPPPEGWGSSDSCITRASERSWRAWLLVQALRPSVSGDLALGLLDLWPPERAEAGPASPGLPSPKAPAPPRALSEQGLRNSGLQGQQEHGCRRGKVREASLRSALRMDRPLNPQTQRHRLQTNDKRATSGCKCVEVLQDTFYLFPIYNVLMKGHSTHLELEKLRLKEP